MTHASVLDSAAFIDESREPVRDVSRREDGAVISHDVGGAGRNIRTWRLRFEPATNAQARAVLDHFEDVGLAAFDFNPPEGTTVRATYRAPPVVRWRSPTAASVTVELEEALVEQ